MVFAPCDNGVSAYGNRPQNRHAGVIWPMQHGFPGSRHSCLSPCRRL